MQAVNGGGERERERGREMVIERGLYIEGDGGRERSGKVRRVVVSHSPCVCVYVCVCTVGSFHSLFFTFAFFPNSEISLFLSATLSL